MSNKVSIRKRVTWYVIAIMTIMSLISGIAVYRGTTHEADEIFDAALAQTARVLEGLLTDQSINANKEHLEAALARYADAKNLAHNRDDPDADGHRYEKKLFFAVRNDAGEILLQSLDTPNHEPIPVGPGYHRIEIDGKDWITFSLRSSSHDFWIIVGEKGEIRDEIVEYIGRGMTVPLLLMLPIVIFFLWRLIMVAMQPLQKVIAQIRQQDIKSLSPINAERVPDEVDPLVDAFNTLLGKLDVSYKRERRFVSDASHELRNPLAALLINVDNAIEEADHPGVGESLDSMKTSIGRLSHLVSQLLELSHTENPLSGLHREPVDLGEVCRQVRDIHGASANRQHHTLELAVDDPCVIDGVKALLVSLVSNLVDNAVKYTPENSRIRISCLNADSGYLLRVDDNGEGMPEAERERITERFYRLHGSQTPGAGLGLSIAKSIADIHAAEIHFAESDMGGLRVEVRFPKAE